MKFILLGVRFFSISYEVLIYVFCIFSIHFQQNERRRKTDMINWSLVVVYEKEIQISSLLSYRKACFVIIRKLIKRLI